MNIMLFSKICAKTGVGNHIKELSEELTRQGHRVIIVSGKNDIGIPAQSFFSILTPSLSPKTIIKDLRIIRNIIIEKNIQLVHCHHRMAALYMRIYRLIWKIPVVYTLHLPNIPCDFIHRICTFPGDKAIAVSKEVSRFMIDKLRITPNKVVIIPNGVDESKLHPLSSMEKAKIKKAWNIPDGKYIFAMHSRIDDVKNHLITVAAAAQLPKRFQDKVIIVISGIPEGSYYERVKQEIAEQGLNDIFRFVGWTETRKILGIADFLIAPSKNEGFQLTVCEAFLMKVPVMRTKTGGFEDQRFCYPISGENTDDIVRIMSDYINNNEKYRENTEKAYQYARKYFTVKTMTEKTAEVYHEVCKRQKTDKRS